MLQMDMVGKSGYGVNSVGDANARMLDVTFDDEIWLEILPQQARNSAYM